MKLMKKKKFSVFILAILSTSIGVVANTFSFIFERLLALFTVAIASVNYIFKISDDLFNFNNCYIYGNKD